MSSVAANPPGPKQLIPGTSVALMLMDRIGFFSELAKYGEVVRFKLGGRPAFLLSQPDYIRDVLVTNSRNFHKGRGLQRAKKMLGEGLLTSEDGFHLRQRRLVQPAFHRQRVAVYGETMTEYAERMAAGWQEGATVDISQEMVRLTLGIVSKTLFDADVEAEWKEIGHALAELLEMFKIIVLPFSQYLDKLPLPFTKRFEAFKGQLDNTIYRIIQERRASGEDKGDLLSMLLLAQDVEGDGGKMDNEQVRDEAMTLFLAGHETTANALSWTWYLLAQHPVVEAKLHQELAAVLAGRSPTIEDLPQLKYTEMVLAETMRLYPPSWILGRTAIKDYQVGGYPVPAGSTVFMSQYLMHRDRRYYPEPNRFDPERWTPEGRESRPKFAYFPFGGGPRMCIGETFAWMEGKLLLATLAQQWTMQLEPGQQIGLQPLVTLRPKPGIRMKLIRRAM